MPGTSRPLGNADLDEVAPRILTDERGAAIAVCSVASYVVHLHHPAKWRQRNGVVSDFLFSTAKFGRGDRIARIKVAPAEDSQAVPR
jgi:hypothetical protein